MSNGKRTIDDILKRIRDGGGESFKKLNVGTDVRQEALVVKHKPSKKSTNGKTLPHEFDVIILTDNVVAKYYRGQNTLRNEAFDPPQDVTLSPIVLKKYRRYKVSTFSIQGLPREGSVAILGLVQYEYHYGKIDFTTTLVMPSQGAEVDISDKRSAFWFTPLDDSEFSTSVFFPIAPQYTFQDQLSMDPTHGIFACSLVEPAKEMSKEDFSHKFRKGHFATVMNANFQAIQGSDEDNITTFGVSCDFREQIVPYMGITDIPTWERFAKTFIDHWYGLFTGWVDMKRTPNMTANIFPEKALFDHSIHVAGNVTWDLPRMIKEMAFLVDGQLLEDLADTIKALKPADPGVAETNPLNKQFNDVINLNEYTSSIAQVLQMKMHDIYCVLPLLHEEVQELRTQGDTAVADAVKQAHRRLFYAVKNTSD